MHKETLSATQHPLGFEIRVEKFVEEHYVIEMSLAYTTQGECVGDVSTAERLYSIGIVPEKRDSSHDCCSIGFCDKEQKWYGWSHRAICGFGVGDAAKEGDIVTDSGWSDEYLALHPEADLSLPVGFVAQSLEDCKRMAVAFADAVS